MRRGMCLLVGRWRRRRSIGGDGKRVLMGRGAKELREAEKNLMMNEMHALV